MVIVTANHPCTINITCIMLYVIAVKPLHDKVVVVVVLEIDSIYFAVAIDLIVHHIWDILHGKERENGYKFIPVTPNRI